MNNHKADLMLIDKSYPVFSELLTCDDWKLVHQDKISAIFLPAGKPRERWIELDSDLTLENNVFKLDITEKSE